MARFRSTKRVKELKRKAKHEAKAGRKRDRQEQSGSGEPDDDIDWSQAVGMDPPPGTVPEPSEGADGDTIEADDAEGNDAKGDDVEGNEEPEPTKSDG